MHFLTIVLALGLGAHKAKVAVLDVHDVSGDQALHARLLTQIIAGELARDGSFEVISSVRVDQMLDFTKQKQLLGCDSSDCLAELAGAMGVEYLVMGQLSRIGTRFRCDLSLVNQVKARTNAAVGGFLPGQDDDAFADAAVALVNELLVKAGLRKGVQQSLTQPALPPAKRSRTGAYVSYGVAGALLVGAAVMTVVAQNTFDDAVEDYRRQPTLQSSHGEKLSWMSPLTDGLWAGGVIAAGVGTYLFFSSAPAGSGGEVGIGGAF